MEKGQRAGHQKNSNPYDNLALIWEALCHHASAEDPLTAREVHQYIVKRYGAPQSPDVRSVDGVLRERSGMMNLLFGRAVVVPSETTVQKMLRKQSEETENMSKTLGLRCQAKVPNRERFEDYHDACEKKADAGKPLTEKGMPTRYYHLESPLSVGEWRILADLIRFSPWISGEQTSKFLTVIRQLCGLEFPSEEAYYHFKRKHDKQFDIIKTLHQGVGTRKKVHLTYGTYQLQQAENGPLLPRLVQRTYNGTLIVAPRSLLWANGFYYLVGQHEKFGTMHLRVDRILTATLTKESFEQPEGFSGAELRDRAPAMYGGVPVLVCFTCPAAMLNTVMDFFGTTPQYRQNGNRLEVQVQATEAGILLFALQYVDKVEITAPDSLRATIKNRLQQGMNKY